MPKIDNSAPKTLQLKTTSGLTPGKSGLNDLSEHWRQLPEQNAQGTIWCADIRPGIQIVCSDYRVKKRLTFQIENQKPGFVVGFVVSGHCHGRSVGMRQEDTTCGGQSKVWFFPEQTGITVDEPGTHRRSLGLIIEPHMFNTLIREETDYLPRDFRRAAEGAVSEVVWHNAPVAPEMHHAINQVMNCTYEGLTRRLFLESKAIELFAFRLQVLAESTNKAAAPGSMLPNDMEKVYYAAELLDQRIQEPPSLFTLAKTVGLSHVKLNRGFRSVFGTTAFGYLRQIRLQKAKLLLENRQMNVTEAAFEVGYSSLSAFSRAFAQQYGVTPHRCGRKSTLSLPSL